MTKKETCTAIRNVSSELSKLMTLRKEELGDEGVSLVSSMILTLHILDRNLCRGGRHG